MEKRLKAAYGLDKPLYEQFYAYLLNMGRGTFGYSYRYTNQTVFDIIRPSLFISPVLAIAALVVAMPLGVFLGVFAAPPAEQLEGYIGDFWAGDRHLHPQFRARVFPDVRSGGKAGPAAGGRVGQAGQPGAGRSWSWAVAPAAYLARLTRTYMLEVLQNDYVRTARAKGLRPRLVVYRHALRNALVPLLTTIGLIFGGLLSGTFVVEKVFNIPGLGSLAIDSIFARDYPVVMTIVLLFTAFYSLINLIVDLLYAVVDPRIRFTSKS